MLSRLWKRTDRLESWKGAGIYLAAVFSLRVWIENTLFPIPIDRYLFLHELSFFYTCFGLLFVLFCALTQDRLTTLLRRTALILTLVLLAPILDALIFRRTEPYDYTHRVELLTNSMTFFLASGVIGKGLVVELGLIIMITTVHVFFSTRSLVRCAVGASVMYVGIQLLAAPDSYIRIPEPIWPGLPYHAQAVRLSYYCFYVILTLGVLLAGVHLRNPPLVRKLVFNIRPLRTTVFVLLNLLGFRMTGRLQWEFPSNVYALAASLAVFLLWQSSVVLNDCADGGIDKINKKERPIPLGLISADDYRAISWFLAGLGLATSFLLGSWPFLLAGLFIVISVLYSVKPFYWKSTLLSYPLIGLAGAIAFLVGYSAAKKLGGEVPFAAWVVFIGVTLGVTTKDLADFSGDRNFGVRNLFAFVDPRTGKRYLGLLLFGLFPILSIWYRNPRDIAVFVTLGAIVGLGFLWKGWYQLVLLGTITALAYLLATGCAGSGQESHRMQARAATEYYETKGFVLPDLRLEVDIRAAGFVFQNFSYAEPDRFVVILDKSALDPEEFIICHEAFHFVQHRYLNSTAIDPETKTWLTEPTANVMAAGCSNTEIPFPRPPFIEDVLSNRELATFFWQFLLREDEHLIRDYLASLEGRRPDKTRYRRWLEERTGRLFEQIVEEFERVY